MLIAQIETPLRQIQYLVLIIAWRLFEFMLDTWLKIFNLSEDRWVNILPNLTYSLFTGL